MKTDDAIEFFGGRNELAKALGINVASVYDWKELVPQRRQYEIEKISRGKLKASWPAPKVAA